MDNELIERCAIACFRKLCPGIRYTEEDKIFYKEAQIASITAMREPTEKMIIQNKMSQQDVEKYQRIIDTILLDETYGSNCNPIIEAEL
jgi:hypothetical protein